MTHAVKKIKKPWPTKEAMQQIYDQNLWGGEDGFYSGLGSHDPAVVEPYIETVKTFLATFETPLSVVDLGCGDFNVGKELVPYSKNYIGVDIVSDLIERNKAMFQLDNLEFYSLDIARDELPAGDIVIIRQVLQHLSNDEVKQVVEKLYNYKYVLLTEHLPEGEFEPNKDIISGQGIRLKKGSGLDLLKPPFNFRVSEVKSMLSTTYPGGKGVIVSTLYVLG